MKPSPALPSESLSRRDFLKAGGGLFAALALGGGCSGVFPDFLTKKPFRELSPQEIKKLLAFLSRDYSAKYGKTVTVEATAPLDGTLFGYGLDLSRCVGCRRCVYACVKENNQSRNPQIHWIRVLEMPKTEGVNLSEANPYYNPPQVPRPGHFYMPTACQQCRRPPCTRVCPVGATWQEPDGIVTIDYDWCIGCRCCMSACPYGARHFDWGEPQVPPEQINPDTDYLGNRPRTKGVVEKCTFCLQRVRKGRYPACVEICPVGARKFGNLNDPDSEIRYLMENKRVFIFKEELNTGPKFYYFYGI